MRRFDEVKNQMKVVAQAAEVKPPSLHLLERQFEQQKPVQLVPLDKLAATKVTTRVSLTLVAVRMERKGKGLEAIVQSGSGMSGVR